MILFLTEISTHTLTWSVTLPQIPIIYHRRISTHTLTWSVTMPSPCKTVSEIISTHTLTWSVTLQVFANFNIILYFNSHAHVERDICSSTTGKRIAISTHTLTWSVTLSIFGNSGISAISTHTLTWSVTVWPLLSEYSKAISTHTLTWSVTQRWYGENCRGKFQLTRSRGAWPIGVNANFNMKHFNSHAHVERDTE